MLYIILGVTVVVFVFFIISTFNVLVKKRNQVKNAWSDIDVQLKRRYDLIPNLVETVKGYKGYEASLLENVTKARAGVLSAQGVVERAQTEDVLSGALRSLFVSVEAYPELQASVSFKTLQDQLVLLENDIQSARRYYNATVREFNTAIQTFPSSIIASAFRFHLSEFFGAQEGERGTVAVSF
jgi:LemA protein